MHEVATSIIQTLGSGSVEIMGSQDQHHEARLLQLNCDKAYQDLGWQPRWGVEKTLAATAEWYKTFMTGGSVEHITRTQLQDFFPELL